MLEKRSYQREQLDNLSLTGEELHKTLDNLSLVNRWLGNTNAVFTAVKRLVETSSKPIHIVDLGCGGGDNLQKIAHWASQQHREVTLTGIDGNESILDYARQKSADTIHYVQADILAEGFTLPECDVLISSHFMYHFDDEALIHFLKRAKHRVRHAMIFSELQRHAIPYQLFAASTLFLPFTPMAKTDGRTAIKRSLTRKEWNAILDAASLADYSIVWKWAFRYLVRIHLHPTT